VSELPSGRSLFLETERYKRDIVRPAGYVNELGTT